jgi:hypothetical protein
VSSLRRASVGLVAGLLVATSLLAGCSVWFDADSLGGESDAQAPGSGGVTSDGAPDVDAAADASPDATPAPADVAGAYTASVTNGANECGLFGSWVEGAVMTDVPVTITQEATAIAATVEGTAGFFLNTALGSRVFQGEAVGGELDLTLYGTTPFMSGACTYTVNAVLSATVDGDLLQGAIEYRPSTNGSPDCGALDDCSTSQRFNGSRPPS